MGSERRRAREKMSCRQLFWLLLNSFLLKKELALALYARLQRVRVLKVSLCRRRRYICTGTYSSHKYTQDLAGHERYLKTTLYGLTSGAPSLVLLMVGANAGLIGMSKEHLAIALALSVPVAVCITKVIADTTFCLLFRKSF